MPDFIFAYHGGTMPDTPEEGARQMAAWNAWYGALGAAIVSPGGPVGKSKTVSSTGVADNGGANPLSGYTVVHAADMGAAVKMTKGCPILAGGTVEVVQILEM